MAVQKTKSGVVVSGDTIETRELIQKLKATDKSRSQIYQIIKTMVNDPTTETILNSIMEKVTVPFDDGRTIRATAEVASTQNFVNQLLDQFDAHAKTKEQTKIAVVFGELIVRMFTGKEWKRKFEFSKERPEPVEDKEEEKGTYVKKIETVSNPLEFYEVQYLGETINFYKKPINEANTLFSSAYNTELFKYSNDILIHKILYPNIMKEKMTTGEYDGDGESVILTVERGKGLLESAYPAYVDLKLAEAAMLMARDARSVVVTLLQVQCEEMEDDEADEVVDAILEKVSVRRTINNDGGVSEYTNSISAPAIIVTSKKGETGRIETDQIGGDYDAGSLSDIEYLENVYFGAFRTIKQQFGRTKDAAGFSGGESLVELKSSEAAMIRTIQQMVCETWEEVINRFLESNGRDGMAGTFSLNMVKPATQEETDKEDGRNRSIQMADSAVSGISQRTLEELKLYRAMVNRIDLSEDVMQVIDSIIENKEKEGLGGEEYHENDDFEELDDLEDLDEIEEPEIDDSILDELPEASLKLPDFNKTLKKLNKESENV